MNTSKLWLVGMSQNRERDVEELTRGIGDYFDGLVFVVNQPSTDKTQEILESRKKNGKIIARPFVPNHGHLMNEIVMSGVIQNLDYMLIVDSSDRVNLEWAENLRKQVNYYAANGVGAVFLDRIFLVRHLDGCGFFGGVHWGYGPIIGNVVNLSGEPGYKKENYIINTRSHTRESHVRSALQNPLKYFIEYPSFSEIEIMYSQFGEDIYRKHVEDWLAFRIYCQKTLNLRLKVDNVISFYNNGIASKTLPEFVINYTEQEFRLKDLVRFYILKQELEEICDNRFCWSFKKFYFDGIEHQKRSPDYVGIVNQYRIAQGKNPE